MDPPLSWGITSLSLDEGMDPTTISGHYKFILSLFLDKGMDPYPRL